ncbi:MAG: energy-coupling factor ABC transporter ATP-binding protein [Treponema sp.]|nr:energy-coupling factor ABC transporter ATP-binding protein [Treponema sp.]
MSTAPDLLDVYGLSAFYPGGEESLVLEDVSFSVAEGEKIALLGANGAGKSTLLLTLMGIIEPHSGRIEVEGTVLEKKTLPLIRRKLGLLFQNPDDQLFMPTVYEDVIFGLQNNSVDTAGRDAAAILERLEITHLKDRMPHNLSGGEKRLAALASVLVMEPRLLLADEPSAFLDPRARRRLIAVLESLSQACLIATHDSGLILSLCARCMVLHSGRIRADGPAAAIIGDRALLESCGL